MASSKYKVYKKNKDDKVWWVDNYDVVGEFLFTFDRKKVYNLFMDYPHKLSVEEWMMFNAENKYWEEFFKERNARYLIDHGDDIEEYLNKG